MNARTYKAVKKKYAVRYLIVNPDGDVLWIGSAVVTSDSLRLATPLEVAVSHAVTANTVRADCDRTGVGVPGRVLITAMWEASR